MLKAAPISVMRKNTQPMQTTWKVSKTDIAENNLLSKNPFKTVVFCRHWLKLRCTIKQSPWKTPQTTKFHAAPCHKPPRAIVKSKLRSVLSLEPFEPPRGM